MNYIELPDALIQRYNELLQNIDIQNTQYSIYRHLSRKIGYSDELKQCIEGTIANLYDTNLKDEDAKRPGLLLGKIQSGKTRAFVGCIALAFDNGVDACIVLTKNSRQLANQTVSRLKSDFEDFSANNRLKNMPIVSVYDIINQSQGLNRYQINTEKNIFVSKKEDDNLARLSNVFLSECFRDKRVLIIDDEADFVSHSFRVTQNNTYAGTIARQIDELVGNLQNCRYLQVTATPYSLYLQPNDTVEVENGKVLPFRPRFTALVPIHNQYVGSDEFFNHPKNDGTMYGCIHIEYSSHLDLRLVSDGMNTLLDPINYEELKDNVCTDRHIRDIRKIVLRYIVASSIRTLQEGNHYRSSLLIHKSTRVNDHNWEYELLSELLKQWCTQIINNTLSIEFERHVVDSYNDFNNSISLGRNIYGEAIPEIPAQDDVKNQVLSFIREGAYIIQCINSEENTANLLDDSGQLELKCPLNIFIGGSVLDRGITINNLLGFLYGRDPEIAQQGSILQHCRMFGNRSLADMSVTRLFSPKKVYDRLKRANELDDLMRSKFTSVIENPESNPSIECVMYDRNQGLIPCNRNNLAISKLSVRKPNTYIKPFGFQTINNRMEMSRIVEQIRQKLLEHQERRCWLMNVETVADILRWSRQQFEYNNGLGNTRYNWDVEEMIAIASRYSRDNNVKVYFRNNCEISRKRRNGDYNDAPVDGERESPYIKSQAVDYPVLMLLHQRGDLDRGWLGYPFYWPVLCLPQNIESFLFCEN